MSAAVLFLLFSGAPVRGSDGHQRSRRQGNAIQIHAPNLRSQGGPLQSAEWGHLPEDRHRNRSTGEPDAGAGKAGRKCCWRRWSRTSRTRTLPLWFYLGRIYLQQGDLAGADSALTKAEALSPACKKDISDVRYLGWVPLVNAGITFTKEEKNDSALALYRQANSIYRDKPLAFLNAGVIFANAGQTDSAIVYFQKASEIAEQTNSVEDRNLATRNWGALLQRAGRHKEAMPVLEKYVGWVPKDVEVKRALATSYRATGQNDKAAGHREGSWSRTAGRRRGRSGRLRRRSGDERGDCAVQRKEICRGRSGLREGARHRAVQS